MLNKFARFFFSFLFQFCDVAKLTTSSTIRYSQFWLLIRCKSKFSFKNPFIFWLLVGSYCRNIYMAIGKKSKSCQLRPFFPTKILCLCGNLISWSQNFDKNFQKITKTNLKLKNQNVPQLSQFFCQNKKIILEILF